MVGKLFAVIIALVTVVHASATTVTFQGYLYGLNPSGTVSPVIGGRIIVGTFKPGFDVGRYTCIYGSPGWCNLDSNNYYEAVADGNFIPLSNVFDFGNFLWTDRGGVLTTYNGYFQGFGATDAVGSQLWIFGFAGAEPVASTIEVLASSSGDAFRVPASGSVSIDAAQTNMFILGQHYSDGIALTLVPIPEPTCLILFSIAVVMLGSRRR
jgi:hypothetical protein